MTAESTITSVSRNHGDEPADANACDHLIVLARCDQPSEPSTRHILDDLDEVRFGRGDRSTTRRDRVLELRFPDPRMSSEHGRLVRGATGWLLDDPSSKNGTIVAGELTRRMLVGAPALIELGRTFLWFDRAAVADPGRLDVAASDLAAPHPSLVTFSGSLAARFVELARLAATDVSVILLGDTGTGKEVVARAMHELSRRPGAFVAVNCGGLPENLVENELFGHKKGAFSGAVGERLGLVRSADGGTLFLDEIGELPPSSQTALLRVLQEQEVVPIGADRPVKVDLRVCCATLRDLDEMIEAGGFRRDLYARLCGYTIALPPLRERRADLGLLVAAVLGRIQAAHPIQLTPAAMRALVRHDWPLNIRELHKVLTSAVALSPDGTIDLPHLPDAIRRARPATSPPGAGEPDRDGADVDDDDDDRALRDRLVALLTEHAGNVVVVAEKLGKRRMQIYRWVKKLDIDLALFRK